MFLVESILAFIVVYYIWPPLFEEPAVLFNYMIVFLVTSIRLILQK